jgi:excisionase family DNA binding protein
MAVVPAGATPLLNPVPVVATRLGVSKQYIRNLIAAGRLRAIRLGTRVLVSEDELQRFVDRLEDAAR